MQAVLITHTKERASQDHDYSKILFTQKWNELGQWIWSVLLLQSSSLSAEKSVEAVAAMIFSENEK